RVVAGPARVAPGRNHVRVTSPLIRIGTEDAYVDIIKGVRPERIIRVGPERIVNEVPVRERPEHGSEPTDHENRTIVQPPPSSIAIPMASIPFLPIPARQCAVETRLSQHAGGAVARCK